MLTADQLNVLYLIRKSLGKCQEDIDIHDSQYLMSVVLKNGILLTVYKTLPAEIREKHKNKGSMQKFVGFRVPDVRPA